MFVLIKNCLFLFIKFENNPEEGNNIIVQSLPEPHKKYKIPSSQFPIFFLADHREPKNIKVVSLNLGHHVQTNQIAGSEADMVRLCQNTYPLRNGLVEYPSNKNEHFISQCSYNAMKFIAEQHCALIGLQEYIHKEYDQGNLFQLYSSFGPSINKKIIQYNNVALIYDEAILGPGTLIYKNLLADLTEGKRPLMVVYFSVKKLIVINLHMPHIQPSKNGINISTTFHNTIKSLVLPLNVARIIVMGDFNDYQGQLKELKIEQFILTRGEHKVKTCCMDTGFIYPGDYIFDSHHTGTGRVNTSILMSDHFPIMNF